jgi:hypothetical protein
MHSLYEREHRSDETRAADRKLNETYLSTQFLAQRNTAKALS